MRIEACFPRSYLDANRNITEIDTSLFDEAWPDPAHQRHSIQLEINRKLYMNEQTLAISDGFAPLQASLRSLVAWLLQTDPRER